MYVMYIMYVMYVMYIMYVMYVCRHGNCMLTQAQHGNPMWNQFRETQTWKLHANPGKLCMWTWKLHANRGPACEPHVKPMQGNADVEIAC